MAPMRKNAFRLRVIRVIREIRGKNLPEFE
jgi:hypothetical protein